MLLDILALTSSLEDRRVTLVAYIWVIMELCIYKHTLSEWELSAKAKCDDNDRNDITLLLKGLALTASLERGNTSLEYIWVILEIYSYKHTTPNTQSEVELSVEAKLDENHLNSVCGWSF